MPTRGKHSSGLEKLSLLEIRFRSFDYVLLVTDFAFQRVEMTPSLHSTSSINHHNHRLATTPLLHWSNQTEKHYSIKSPRHHRSSRQPIVSKQNNERRKQERADCETTSKCSGCRISPRLLRPQPPTTAHSFSAALQRMPSISATSREGY